MDKPRVYNVVARVLGGLIFFLALVGTLCAAKFYRWIDAQGTVHITDSWSKVPPRYREKAVLVEMPSPESQKGPLQAPSTIKKASPVCDAYGRDLSWYLEKKRKWLREIETLSRQIAENERVMVLLHRGVPRARRGVRTEYGLKLEEGPLLRRWAEYKRLQKINQELRKRLARARYMAREGILRQAARAQAPPEWLEIIRQDP